MNYRTMCMCVCMYNEHGTLTVVKISSRMVFNANVSHLTVANTISMYTQLDQTPGSKSEVGGPRIPKHATPNRPLHHPPSVHSRSVHRLSLLYFLNFIFCFNISFSKFSLYPLLPELSVFIFVSFSALEFVETYFSAVFPTLTFVIPFLFFSSTSLLLINYLRAFSFFIQDRDRWRAVVSAVMNLRVLTPRS
jgi:hypothetical protein